MRKPTLIDRTGRKAATSQVRSAGNVLARCPICGDGLLQESWRCSRCETPHHHDCVKYFGGCAIYGCKDGRPASPLERAYWPWAFTILRAFAVVRSIQPFVLLACLSGPVIVTSSILTYGLVNAAGGVSYSFGTGILICAGLLYFVLDIVGNIFLHILANQMSGECASTVQLSNARMKEIIPSIQNRSRIREILGAVGVALGVVALVFGMLKSTQILVMLGFLSLMFISTADQIGNHMCQVSLAVNRFVATYGPPAKGQNERCRSAGEVTAEGHEGALDRDESKTASGRDNIS